MCSRVPRRMLCFLLLTAGSILLLAMPARAERPSAPKLLPETTLAYLRIANCNEFIERFKETQFGQIAQDEEIRPLLTQLYGDALDAFGDVEEEIGLSLEDLLELPQGEACIALVSSEGGLPMLTVMLEVGDQMPEAEKLLDRMDDALLDEGAKKTSETVRSTEMITYNPPDEDPFTLFTREGMVVMCSSTILSRQLLDTWDDTAPPSFRSLAENRKFTAIMKRSAGSKGARPQLSWYADPIGMVESFGRASFTVQAVLAALPALGVDGFKALGGSAILAPDSFDSIAHFHISLDFPRSGILEVFEMKSGELAPEPWVPENAASYTTVNWNIEKAFAAVARMYDQIRGEGRFSTMLDDSVSRWWNVDFEEDVIGAMDGRFSYVTWIEPPARVNSNTNLIAFKLKDTLSARKTFDQIMSNFDSFTKTSTRGTTYYSITVPDDANRPDFVRRPTPCLAVVGDYLMFTDSERFLKRVLVTRGNKRGLADQLDYKLIASRIRQQAGGRQPAMISFNRPEEILRSLYELATSDSTQSALANQAENNDFFKVLDRALQDSPLPDFEVIAKYLSPRGAMTLSDETGLHTISFTLKRN